MSFFGALALALMLLFGISVPIPPGPPDEPDLDCSRPLSGEFSNAWGLAPQHRPSGWTLALDGDSLRYTVESSEGDVATASRSVSPDEVRALCEAVNRVPGSEWHSDLQVTDIGQLQISVGDGATQVEGGAYSIDGHPRMQAVSEAISDLIQPMQGEIGAQVDTWDD